MLDWWIISLWSVKHQALIILPLKIGILPILTRGIRMSVTLYMYMYIMKNSSSIFSVYSGIVSGKINFQVSLQRSGPIIPFYGVNWTKFSAYKDTSTGSWRWWSESFMSALPMLYGTFGFIQCNRLQVFQFLSLSIDNGSKVRSFIK